MIQSPSAFISYSWESDDLKYWVKKLAFQLRENGIDAKLDQWEVVLGDQLPHFMEKSVKNNNFVLIICTPKYKIKSDNRIGGVGYEGDIMTSDVMLNSNHRKFIPILKSGSKENSLPEWLKGKYFVDMTNELYFERNLEDLITTLLNVKEGAPKLGKVNEKFLGNNTEIIKSDTEIKIKGILINEVTQPYNDGSRKSALYKIPFELNRRPEYEWNDFFVSSWNNPPRFTSMHRPGIASVYGNKIYLDGTDIEEVEKYHKETLKLAVSQANYKYNELLIKRQQLYELELQRLNNHKNKIEEISRRINFND